jgi:DNA-binding LacI/PurR family transcriptional regulator
VVPIRRGSVRSPRERGARGATIRDVALAAGVGIGTVSRALGSGELVSPETLERVRAAAIRVGYRPSRAAKVLRGAAARIIGVLIPDISLPLYVEWLRGAGEVAREHGYVLLVCDGQNSQRVMDEQIDRLYGEQIDGLAVPGPVHGLPRIQSFVESGIPVVPRAAKRSSASRKGRDGEKPALHEAAELSAARDAFDHLVSLGHRRIAYFAHVERDQRQLSGMQRYRIGCLRESLARVDAALEERFVLTTDGPEECRGKLAALLEQRERPTAFVAGTEALTPAVLAALSAAGVRIPAEASVVAFGDSLWERAFQPPISVVRLDYRGAGRAMLANLIARIERTKAVPRIPSFPSEFVDRGSCARPGSRSSTRRGRA